VYKILLPIISCDTLDVEEDLYSVSSTANFNQLIAMDVTEKGYESWYQMCFSSTSLLLHAIIVKFPSQVTVLRLSMSEAIPLTKSSLWQVQLIALSVVRSLLHVDLFQIQKYQREKAIRSIEQELETLTNGKSKKSFSKQFTGKQSVSISQTAQPSPSLSLKSKSAKEIKKSESQSLLSSTTRLESKSAGNISRVASQTMRGDSSLGLSGGQNDITSFTQQAEEICRMGFLRSLVWLLFHRHFRVRMLAAQILQIQSAICRDPCLAEDSVVRKPNVNVKIPECQSQMWSSIIEQGVLPLLETCASGFVVFQSSEVLKIQKDRKSSVPKFPEVPIRNVARLLLDDVMHHAEHFVNIRHRLLTALTYSGNQKLRLNVLCSILCLCGQSPILGSYLWDSNGIPPSIDASGIRMPNHSGDSVSMSFPLGGQAFASLCSSLVSDPSSAKQILDIIIQMFQIACSLCDGQKLQRELSLQKVSPNEIATQTENEPKSQLQETVHEVAFKLRESLPPTVLVNQELNQGHRSSSSGKSSRNSLVVETSRQVKMTCPKLHVIRSFSTILAQEIEKHHFMQIEEAANFYLQMNGESWLHGTVSSANIEDAKQIDKSLRMTIANFSSQYFVTLDAGGSYSDWQEVFSHMCATSLRKRLLGKMNIQQLCACMSLAYQYEMDPLICSYVNMLCVRISSGLILPTLRCAIQEFRASSNPRINLPGKKVHLHLSLACLEFLRKEWEFCIRRKEMTELKEILQCLCTIFGIFLLP
jgi:hypothetical protein